MRANIMARRDAVSKNSDGNYRIYRIYSLSLDIAVGFANRPDMVMVLLLHSEIREQISMAIEGAFCWWNGYCFQAITNGID